MTTLRHPDAIPADVTQHSRCRRNHACARHCVERESNVGANWVGERSMLTKKAESALYLLTGLAKYGSDRTDDNRADADSWAGMVRDDIRALRTERDTLRAALSGLMESIRAVGRWDGPRVMDQMARCERVLKGEG